MVDGGEINAHTTKELRYVVTGYLFLSTLSITFFGLLHTFIEHNPFLGLLELGGSVALILNWIGLRLTHNVVLARTLLLCSVGGLLVIMLATGGTQATGIFWFFVFPVMTFFLAGKNEGLKWMAGLLVSIFLIALLARL